jgi:hypothetical protein
MARENAGVFTFDPSGLLCDHIKCHAILRGVRAYRPEDNSHLSDQGALLFLPKLEALVK